MSDLPVPSTGGSYLRDDETGTLILANTPPEVQPEAEAAAEPAPPVEPPVTEEH